MVVPLALAVGCEESGMYYRVRRMREDTIMRMTPISVAEVSKTVRVSTGSMVGAPSRSRMKRKTGTGVSGSRPKKIMQGSYRTYDLALQRVNHLRVTDGIWTGIRCFADGSFGLIHDVR